MNLKHIVLFRVRSETIINRTMAGSTIPRFNMTPTASVVSADIEIVVSAIIAAETLLSSKQKNTGLKVLQLPPA